MVSQQVKEQAVLSFFAHVIPTVLKYSKSKAFVCPHKINGAPCHARLISTIFSFGLHLLISHYGLRINRCFGCSLVTKGGDLRRGISDHYARPTNSCQFRDFVKGLTLEDVEKLRASRGIQVIKVPKILVVHRNTEELEVEKRSNYCKQIRGLSSEILNSHDAGNEIAKSAIEWLACNEMSCGYGFHLEFIDLLEQQLN